MNSARRQALPEAGTARFEAPLPYDWMTPVDVDSPCGPDLEYDPEFVVLSSQLAARMDAQYGDFVGTPEPVDWGEAERDCRRLLLRSKDMRLAVLFTRCRTRLAASSGLAEGLTLLAAWLGAFPETVHPQPGVDDDLDVASEIRMNALQTLTDTDGLMSDVREIALTRSSAARLQVRDVERAFAYPRPVDSLAPESVTRQIDDLRSRQPDALAGFEAALTSLECIESWCKGHLGVYQPDFSTLSRLLRRVIGDAVTTVSVPQEAPCAEAIVPETSGGGVLAGSRHAGLPRMVASDTVALDAGTLSLRDRDEALDLIREARHWFEQHEPSSPIPVLLRRAEQFVGKRYADVVKAIPAELLEQWERQE